MTIPALVNCRSGSAEKATEALTAHGGFDVRQVEPASMTDALRKVIASGASRVAVAGGDGTLASAAELLAGSPVEMAVVPGGTLNHFAGFLGVPDDHAKAAELAATGAVRAVDVGYVNDRLVLNTSSVGAYVLFVRVRERFERHGLPYWAASLVAFVRSLFLLRTFRVFMDIEGEHRVYQTPLVFVGIGEREMRLPAMGDRVKNGRRGLHVLVIRGRGRARLILLGVAIAARGVRAIARLPKSGIDSFVVECCRIEMRRPRGNVGVDGELVSMVAPLAYRYVRDALRVVVPEESDEKRVTSDE